jgi:Tol biopolymer transport system component
MSTDKKTKFRLLLVSALAAATAFIFSYSMALAASGAQWPSDTSPSDILVANSANNLSSPAITTFADGDFFAVWVDSGDSYLYAQKLSGTDGSAVWGSPVQIANGTLTESSLAADGLGNIFLLYSSGGTNYLQKINSSGALQWGSGISVSSASYRGIVPDEAGGVYAAWGGFWQAGYITHRDSTGAVDASWNTGNGGADVQINSGLNHSMINSLMRDSSGNILIIFGNYPDGYATKIDANGTIAGSPWNGPLLITSNYNMRAEYDNNGGFVVSNINGSYEIIGRHIDSTGSDVWGGSVVVASANSNFGDPRITIDGSGGAIVTWENYSTSEIYADHVLNTGVIDSSWSGPVIFGSGSFSYERNAIAYDGNGGAYILYDGGATLDIEHILSDGTFDYPEGSLALGNQTGGSDDNPAITYNGSTGAAVLWQGFNANADMYAQYMDDIIPEVPGAPANLMATGNYGSVDLEWDASAGATSYNLYVSEDDGGPYDAVTDGTGIPENSFNDTDVVNGTTYYYVVRAVNGVGESLDSNQAEATPFIQPPANFSANGNDGSVDLTWDTSTGATSYNLFVSEDDGGPYDAVTGGTGIIGNSFNDTDVVNDTTYYYVITATDGVDESEYSSQASATPGAYVGKVEIHIQSISSNNSVTTGISDGSTGSRDITSLGTPAFTTNPAPPVAVQYTFDGSGNATETGIPYSFDTLTAPTTIALEDGSVSASIPLPFFANIFGRYNNIFSVTGNGFMYLNLGAISASGTFGCCGYTMSDLTGNDFAIAGIWTNLWPSGSPNYPDEVRYQVFGSTPNRYMVVEYNDVSQCCDNNGGNTFQIKLFESSPPPDTDADTIPDPLDNCPSVPNIGQENTDGWVDPTLLVGNDGAYHYYYDQTFSPDRSKITYIYNNDDDGTYDIGIMDADGDNNQLITTSGLYKEGPLSFSPDGSKVTYSIYDPDDDDYEIAFANTNGSGETILTDNTTRDSYPYFNPVDSNQIGYQSNDGDYDQIAVINTNATGQQNLTSSSYWNYIIGWSPDGTKISYGFHDGNDGEIGFVYSNGSGGTVLTSNDYDDYDAFFNPADSDQIIYSAYDGNDMEIAAINTDLTNPLTLTVNDYDDSINFDYSSNSDPYSIFNAIGTQIAYRTYDNNDGDYEIAVVNTDGSGGQLTLTDNTWDDGYPVFNSSGTQIAFQTYYSGSESEIAVINTDGSGFNLITNNSNDDYSPSFNLNGTQVIFSGDITNGRAIYTKSTAVWDTVGNVCDCQGDGLCTAQAYCIANPPVDPDCGSGDIDDDGIPDDEDNCPTVSNPLQENTDITPTPTNLTDNISQDSFETFSSDGLKIAFQSDRDGDNEIYTMDSDGSNLEQLTFNTATDSNPRFSPDGTIAFISARDGNYEVYTMDADGTNQVNRTNAAGDDYLPVFSPDGSTIAFYSMRDGNAEIYTMDADGTNQVNRTNNAGSDVYNRPMTPFSPDGSTIVFDTDRDGNTEIYTMNADGSNQTNRSNNAGNDNHPIFSADGSQIAFDSDRDADIEVYTMNADGSNQINITNSPIDDIFPIFSPTENKIVLESYRDGNGEIYLIDFVPDSFGDVCDCETDTFCTARLYCIANPPQDSDCTPAGSVPDAITNLIASGGNEVATLTWRVPNSNDISNITGFNIGYDPVGGGFTDSATTTPSASCTGSDPGDTCSYLITGLANFSEYEFRVTSTNDIGISDYSNIAQTMPVPCGPMDINNQTDDNPLTVSTETCVGVTVEEGSLVFEHIPTSFTFPIKYTSNSIQNSFSNDNPGTPDLDVATAPDDIITVSDLRNSGGFQVTITPTELSNGTDVMPLWYLWMLTSYPEDNDFDAPIDDPTLIGTEENGVEWAEGSAGAHDITNTASAEGANLNLPSTYTSRGGNFDITHDNVPDVRTLFQTATDHTARVSTALNFMLQIPVSQAPGTYSTAFTVDLISL